MSLDRNLLESIASVEGFLKVEDSRKNGRIVTIFLCGTCSNSEDYKNIRFFAGEHVSTAYLHTLGEPLIDKIIVSGPGSGENDITELWIDYNNGLPYSDLAGQALASGLSERIQHILAVLKNQPTRELNENEKIIHEKLTEINKKNPIKQVNIVGWSRGAAAAITLSNLMAIDPMLNTIDANLFLLDPVPGLGLANINNCKLDFNVKNCYIMYAQDERSFGFYPVKPDYDKTICNFYTVLVPGGHSHLAGDEADHAGKPTENANLRDVSWISRFYLQQFLLYYGTQFDPKELVNLTVAELHAHYEKVLRFREEYKRSAQAVSYTTNHGGDRPVIDGVSHWTKKNFEEVFKDQLTIDSSKYVNLEHQKIETTIKIANEFERYFSAELDEQLKSEKVLDIENIFLLTTQLQAVWLEADNSIMLCRALGESIQAKYKPSDLNNWNLRSNDKKHLESYIIEFLTEKINQHNTELMQNKIEVLDCDIHNQSEEIKNLVNLINQDNWYCDFINKIKEGNNMVEDVNRLMEQLPVVLEKYLLDLADRCQNYLNSNPIKGLSFFQSGAEKTMEANNENLHHELDEVRNAVEKCLVQLSLVTSSLDMDSVEAKSKEFLSSIKIKQLTLSDLLKRMVELEKKFNKEEPLLSRHKKISYLHDVLLSNAKMRVCRIVNDMEGSLFEFIVVNKKRAKCQLDDMLAKIDDVKERVEHLSRRIPTQH